MDNPENKNPNESASNTPTSENSVPNNPLAEKMAERLRTQEKNNRPNFAFTGILLLLLVLGLLGMGVWFFWPTADPVPMHLFTSDHVAAVGESPAVSVLLRPHKTEEKFPQLSGWPVDIRIATSPGNQYKGWTNAARTTQHEQHAIATYELPAFAKSGLVQYDVRYAPKQVHLPSMARGRVWIWPKKSDIVIVPILPQLAVNPPDDLTKIKAANLKANAAAANALTVASKDGKYKILYWVGAITDAKISTTLKVWLQNTSPEIGVKFPYGPILTIPAHLGENDMSQLVHIRRAFSGRISLVSNSKDGFESLLEGEGTAVRWIKTTNEKKGEVSWDSVPKRLAKKSSG